MIKRQILLDGIKMISPAMEKTIPAVKRVKRILSLYKFSTTQFYWNFRNIHNKYK